MDLQTQKLNIIEEVLQLDSSELLEKVASFLVRLKKPAAFPDDLPLLPVRSAAEVQEEYKQALHEMETGDVVSHEEVVALTQQWRQK